MHTNCLGLLCVVLDVFLPVWALLLSQDWIRRPFLNIGLTSLQKCQVKETMINDYPIGAM